MKNKTLTWAEVSLKAIKSNYRAVKRSFPQKKFMAIVKADAYGHGMEKVAGLLNQANVEMFGVSDVQEAVSLRKQGICKPVLIFENIIFSDQASDVLKYKIIPSVYSLQSARILEECAAKKKKKMDIHIKIDTGMGRLGVWHLQGERFVKKIRSFAHLNIQGIFTHFPAADTDKKFTEGQIAVFNQLVASLHAQGYRIPLVHAENSMGLLRYPSNFNMARVGIILYGLSPNPNVKIPIRLKPALSVKSKIIFLKKISKGRSVSYSRTFIADKDMTIATVPIGYNDGYFRAFSNKASCLVSGCLCPVLGRVTMDQIVIDVTKVKNVKAGREVVVCGLQKKRQVTADDLASKANTINYEIACSLGNRLPRIYKD